MEQIIQAVYEIIFFINYLNPYYLIRFKRIIQDIDDN